MFRNRFALAALVALAILPLVGCANRRCCAPTSYAAPAPACCPGPGGPPPTIVGP
ncbi:MAG TPA: hypothetical protein VKD90_22015 [Gemmataceae bacterium]|nr:hypothetical protein [Gemmataceae bacterium]